MSGLITRRAALASAGAAGLALGARPALAQAAPDLGALEALITRAMTTFEQPGLSVAVVRDGQTLMARGFGVRRLGAPETVDEATLFAIASNSKAYTAASLALLVEEGKIGWEYYTGFTPVRRLRANPACATRAPA